MSPVLKKQSPMKKACFPKLDENTFQKEIMHLVYRFRRWRRWLYLISYGGAVQALDMGS